MKPLLALACLFLTGCTTARHRNGTIAFQTPGSVKSLIVLSDGTIQALDVSSPLDSGLNLFQQGMIGKALGVLR